MDAPVKHSLRLASYNIRAGLGTDFRRKPERVLDVIAALNADIIALQEADFRLGARPTALPIHEITPRTGLTPLDIVPNRPSIGWHGIAILARPDITLADVDLIDLPGLEPRGAVISDLETTHGPMRLVAVHLGLMRRSRKAQLAHIRTALSQKSDCPTVMLGDFNEWSTTRGLSELGPDLTILTPAPSFPSSRPVVRLDRIAHCPKVTNLAASIHHTERPHASDHLPLVSDVLINAD